MDYKSKTQKKKEAHSLQVLGEKLLQLSRTQINEIDIPQEILDAIELARTIKSHEGLRRQVQFIGSLMRKIDSDPIQHAVDQIDQGNYQKALEFKETEQWRDELISGNNELMEDLLDQFNADRQQLSQLVRNARKEVGKNKPPKSSRTLFKYLRNLRSD